MLSAVVCAWYRNDLRVHDSLLLAQATGISKQRGGAAVLPVYIFDPRYFQRTRYRTLRTGPLRALFLLQSVLALKRRLRRLGSDLLVAVGKPEKLLPRLLPPGSCIATQQEVTAAELGIDAALLSAFGCGGAQGGNVLHRHWGSTLFHKEDLPYRDNFDDMPESFNTFVRRTWPQLLNSRELFGAIFDQTDIPIRPCIATPAEGSLPPLPTGYEAELRFEPAWADLPFPETLGEPLTDDALLGGEEAGLEHVRRYLWVSDLDNIYYPDRVSDTFGDYFATKLGPWLSHGCLSPRAVHEQLREYEGTRIGSAVVQRLAQELLWRDFFRFYGLKHGNRIFQQGGVKRWKRRWRTDARLFKLWAHGRTGYPLVDACMRELQTRGYMSNRGRLNVASFLAQSMSFDWRMGADWFESHLIDYDVTSNWCNWVRSAGMTDARLPPFNVVRQSEKFDPRGHYVRRWLPELAAVPAELIHEPWMLTDVERSAYATQSYPLPCIDPLCFSGKHAPRFGQASVAPSLYKD